MKAQRGFYPALGHSPRAFSRLDGSAVKAAGFTLIELMIVVAIIAILAAIAISQYQDYLIRSQIAEASSLADGTKTAVAEFYNNYGHFAATNSSYGLASAASITGKYIESVDAGGDVNSGAPGQIVARMKSVSPVNEKIFGQTLTFSPVTHEGSIEWVCNPSSALSAKYVPTACRN